MNGPEDSKKPTIYDLESQNTCKCIILPIDDKKINSEDLEMKKLIVAAMFDKFNRILLGFAMTGCIIAGILFSFTF